MDQELATGKTGRPGAAEQQDGEQRKLRILHIDDSEDFLFMFKLKFKRYFDIDSLSDSSYDSCVCPMLRSNRFDAVVVDYEMPDVNGLDLLKLIKRDFPTIPVIFYTGQGNEEIAREAFISGASDYFVKNVQEFAHKEKLVNSIIRSVEKAKAEETLKQLYEEMEQQVRDRTAELLKANESLQQKQLQQKALLDGIPDLAWLKDREGHYIGVNQPYARASGFTVDELIGKTVFEVWPEEIAQRYHMSDLEVMNSRKIKRFEEPLLESSGVKRWIETIKVPILDNNGEVVGTAGIARDITERLESEKAILDAKNFLDKIINSIPDPVFVKDREHKWILLNDAYCNFMGYSRGELLGKSDFDFFPKSEAEVFWEKDEEVFNSGVENENEEYFTDAEGVTHTIITKKTLYVDSSGAKFIVGIIRDITERKQAEARLRHSHAELERVVKDHTTELEKINEELEQKIQEQKKSDQEVRDTRRLLEHLVNILDEPVFIKDQDHHWIYANNACSLLLGHSRTEILGKTDSDILPKDESAVSWEEDNRLLKAGTDSSIVEREITLPGKSGVFRMKKVLSTDETGRKFIVGTLQQKELQKSA